MLKLGSPGNRLRLGAKGEEYCIYAACFRYLLGYTFPNLRHGSVGFGEGLGSWRSIAGQFGIVERPNARLNNSEDCRPDLDAQTHPNTAEVEYEGLGCRALISLVNAMVRLNRQKKHEAAILDRKGAAHAHLQR